MYVKCRRVVTPELLHLKYDVHKVFAGDVKPPAGHVPEFGHPGVKSGKIRTAETR